MNRRPILITAVALILAMLPGASQKAFASDRVNLHCTFSGESVRDISGADAIHDQSERLWSDDSPFGIWSDGVDFEIEAGSSRVLMRWNGQTIPAHRLLRFRPFHIIAGANEADIARKWLFRLQRLSFSGAFIDVVEAQVDASKTSAGTPRANVGFHGNGSCTVFRACGADSHPTYCTDQHLCIDRAKRCGVFRYDN
jgi:hypothetical protein